MPSPEEILNGLTAIANDWRLLAIFWHGYFAVFILGLLFSARPARSIVGLLLLLPLLSVSLLAWAQGNLFNGAVFALMSVVLLAIAVRFAHDEVKVVPGWLNVLGWLMVGFGLAYPHFLESVSLIEYLYAAPTGLIPCPTLSIVIGFTMILGGLNSRPWCLVLAIMAFFYGVFGIVRLRVSIDGVLILGALVTAYVAFSPRILGDSHGATAR